MCTTVAPTLFLRERTVHAVTKWSHIQTSTVHRPTVTFRQRLPTMMFHRNTILTDCLLHVQGCNLYCKGYLCDGPIIEV